MAGEKTEKATPKRREEAREKGQVAKSMDLNGAAVLLASLLALASFGPRMAERLGALMRTTLGLISDPSVVEREGIGSVLGAAGTAAFAAGAPIALICLLAGVIVSVLQVGIKPMPKTLKPDFKRMDPFKGAKNLFGPHLLFETVKTVVKVGVVGTIAGLALFPKLEEIGALVGMSASELLSRMAATVLGIAWRAGIAYLLIAAVDYAWQRYRHEKQLRMEKQEVKEEHKGQSLPAEVKMAQRRRAMQLARARMLAEVPQADVVVTNPTHFAVALRYEAAHAAPQVVAKGMDLVAQKIRAIAEQHGIPVISDPPLARSLHKVVEVGHVIPEALYQAVAQLLAFVYRTAGRRVAA